MVCKLKEEEYVCAHVQKMQRLIERLEKLDVNFDKDLAINMVLNSFPSCYYQLILTYHLNNTKTTFMQLHNQLQTAKAIIKKYHPTNVAIAHVLAINQGKGKKRKVVAQPKWKGKSHIGDSSGGSKGKANYEVTRVNDLKKAICFQCGQKGHLKRIYPKYLQELKEGKGKVFGSSSGIYTIETNNTQISNSWGIDTGCGFHICFDIQGPRESERVEYGKLNLIVGNRCSLPITRIGIYELMFDSGLRVDLDK